MAIALNNKIQYWGARVRNSPAGAFFTWWTGELKALLPARWQERLQHARRRITLRWETIRLRLGVEENRAIRWLTDVSQDQDVSLQRQQVRGLLEQQEALEVPRFLLLDAQQVLSKQLLLPAATESNLQQVLAFEMDRQTPFRASDVYYTWKLLGVEKDSGQIRVALFVAPRKPVDAVLESLSARGLAASGVDVFDGAQSLGVNLLPPDRRHRVVNPRTRLNLGLAAAALVLLVLVMVESLNFRAGRVSELEVAIADVQDEAREVQRLREQVAETSEAASFLTRRRAASPMAIEVLADITNILPDDTYLDRLVINSSGILMQGKSRNAQQLIEVVNKSTVFEKAAFRGSTRLDAASGLEIFEVNAQVATGGAP
ncbi:MAG TPA: PilN domain-containing protein [Xanthomonadales bacterium]|nr:PilN domain-containing protein [Xanthomonadales bacterium]